MAQSTSFVPQKPMKNGENRTGCDVLNEEPTVFSVFCAIVRVLLSCRIVPSGVARRFGHENSMETVLLISGILMNDFVLQLEGFMKYACLSLGHS